MKTIIVQIDEESYKVIEEKAKKEGYELISDYVKAILLAQQQKQSIPQQLPADIVSQITSKLDKKIQDLLNPFTAQIADLRKKYAELIERIDQLQTTNENNPREERKREEEEQRYINKKRGRKSAMDILNEQGVVFESELKLRNTDAYFNKLEREGAKVVYLDSERIAMSQSFYNEFMKRIKEINSSDPEEAASKLDQKQAKLFKKLVSAAAVIFNADKKLWEPLF